MKPYFTPRLALFGVALLGLSGSLKAQDAPVPADKLIDPDKAPVAPATPATAPERVLSPFNAPPELAGKNAMDGQKVPNAGNVIAPIVSKRPLKIGIYNGPGAPDGSINNIKDAAAILKNATVTLLKPADFESMDLSQFDIIAFSGGMSNTQAEGLGKVGRDHVRNYVYNGGSYLGICAGAYLACSNYSWSLGILNARTISPNWLRGAAFLQLELSDDGRQIFGDTKNKFFVRYHNGPIIEPANRPEIPPYHVDAYFRTEISGFKTTPIGIQVNSPAVVTATYGKGKVLTISPHPENSKGLENFVPRGLVWLGDKAGK